MTGRADSTAATPPAPAPCPGVRAGREFFATDPVTLAKSLLGQLLVRRLDDGTRLSGLIVETEAYLGVADKAAHSYGGRRTARTEAMYGSPGTSYVFRVYGMHHCFNVVCGAVDEPVAVLVRALQPVEGMERMRRLRGAGARRATRGPMADRELCSGPAKLCQALAIDGSLNRVDLATANTIFVERMAAAPMADTELVRTPRIGVDYAQEWACEPLRWMVRGNAHVSGFRRGNT